MKAFYVYILRCSDDSYYTGHTDDLEKRIGEHMSGVTDTYTSKRLPINLVFMQEFQTRGEAISSEQQIKKWSRAKKIALINGDWEMITKLSNKA